MVDTNTIFTLDWTGAVSPNDIQISVDATEGMLFFKNIDWESECIDQNEARAGNTSKIYNEGFSLMFQQKIQQKKLLIFPINPFEIRRGQSNKVKFLIFYYWKEEEKNSWLTRFITKKPTSEIDCESHLADVNFENLHSIISNFLNEDYFAVVNIVNHCYPYFSDDPSEL
ncbi:hypothetical protein [Frigoriflavimonas asaccharolytica]|uniref:Uncharacterized protein n=1 Tax=Frigoriflavimonas asaccharolytica TaxID=2735899 RepID=A0A8J8G7B5_9FLAO|nr:hypothetical protein [Frigoriflavimonas asaccharolytica]NRS92316.1 hypothetical protein [Frigoriflavimonas asaccharolytica]